MTMPDTKLARNRCCSWCPTSTGFVREASCVRPWTRWWSMSSLSHSLPSSVKRSPRKLESVKVGVYDLGGLSGTVTTSEMLRGTGENLLSWKSQLRTLEVSSRKPSRRERSSEPREERSTETYCWRTCTANSRIRSSSSPCV